MRRSTHIVPLVLLAAMFGLLAVLMQPSPARAASTETRVGASTSFAAARVGVATAETRALQPRNNAPYDGVASGDLLAADATATGGGDLAPAVIGEGMSSRVIPYAEQNGYVYYSGVENPAQYTSEELLANNRAQIEAWVAEGRPIIDIGPEPGRALFPMATSPNYAMELNVADGYSGYSIDIVPGGFTWSTASGH